ncbi:SH3 domain-containing protein 19-like [Penaeus monodon]|uniref:SH3 domain-containing protein 19-like n=1 Tax=Penaeus monodon TaxID=6687 RepID=UPI0018A7C92B|nr:SH3 domain-containing protein 19-like [Penaeus monodon]
MAERSEADPSSDWPAGPKGPSEPPACDITEDLRTATMDDILTGDIRPVRRAPPPPRSKPAVQQPRNDDLLVIQSQGGPSCKVPPPRRNANGISRSTSMPLSTSSQKKKVPPPRPPPPKLTPEKAHPIFHRLHKFSVRKKSPHLQEQNGTSSKGVVGGLFGRVRPPPSRPKPSSAHNSISVPSTPVTEAALIDFSSPPGSPTTRSGSDGLSVNSFGSESSSGNQSSGFDDSFDPFGSILDQNHFVPPKKVGVSSFYTGQFAGDNAQTQPCVTEDQDPFEMLARRLDSVSSTPNQQPASASSQIQANPMVLPHNSAQPSTQNVNTGKSEQKANYRPTIIRTKAPVTSSHVESAGGTGNTNKNQQYPGVAEDICSIDWGAGSRPGGVNIIDQTIPEEPPPLPPRPEAEEEDQDRPYGIAEFDFEASQQDDLSFKSGDLIQLLYRMNDDWLFGRCGHKEGMFPQSFIKIVVPLAGEQAYPDSSASSSITKTSSSEASNTSNVVTALYTFQAETPEDLTIMEGSRVCVTGRISEEWLYGECEGRVGQFPANFIDQIPQGLLQM